MSKFNLKTKPIYGAILAAGLGISAVAGHAKSIGPQLSDLLSEATEQEVFEVIVTFEGNEPASLSQLQALESLGVSSGVSFNSLPMVGITATKQQIDAIYSRDDVRSVWYNAPLTLENDGSTELTGVDRLRDDQSMRNMGMPYSGRGIGVVINDSGVDGTHSDIKYPNHVTQNVLAQVNLNSLSGILPITYQEDVANTDIGGGHGSHVAGIIGGNGAMSSGLYQGVAPGAKLIGYGSGAGLFILDTLGGFDYALTHQFDYNIRVISNSFGNTGDTGTDFNPDDPTNVATKALSDNGVIVVFSAGNSGSGEATITGNFKKAPWVITVAAGDKQGDLADFSSRGVKGKTGQAVVDGETFTWEDRPTITAPGVDVISARASLSSLSALSITSDSEVMDANHVPYYTVMSGTSMAAPHASGIVALMLEANPNLTWREVKRILQETATNMPGLEPWESGAGYVNAYAAVKAVLDESKSFGETAKIQREFNAAAQTSVAGEFEITVPFSPVGENEGVTFEVNDEASLLMVRANVAENTVGMSLTSPSGKRYGSSIALPVLGENIAVTAPAEAGTWTLRANGIGGVSGVDVDPVNATNGYALPGEIDAVVKITRTDGFVGLNDVVGHPAQAFIEAAVSEQLVDALDDGFAPDVVISRSQMADYLTLGAGIRQSNAADSVQFIDVTIDTSAINAVTQSGSPLRDRAQVTDPVMTANGNMFNPNAGVSKLDVAYSLVQSLGLEELANSFSGDITAIFGADRVVLEDQAMIPQEFKGYVQLALDLGILNAQFSVEQGMFDLEPTIKAQFNPYNQMTRAGFAVAMTRLYNAR
ncbi:S8 family serine peptidase [Kangiella aquimarina]|uniref:S8 family serine peptidase n=1 Tax=Kangiella aquimarina TaxID=261965 RepID=A0ABZ0X285_9GAMM|nr:S8 family serine peptidase [Kangiella aquimarina]WQG84509.1 S8 family serine peptidase [Kangiella aquimarina]